jgi:hypothetical protein
MFVYRRAIEMFRVSSRIGNTWVSSDSIIVPEIDVITKNKDHLVI